MPGLADSCLASLVGRQLQGSAPAGLVSPQDFLALQENFRSRRRSGQEHRLKSLHYDARREIKEIKSF